MFTGITQGLATVSDIDRQPNLLTYQINLPHELANDLAIGASIAIDGVCQTICKINANTIECQAIQETLDKTTLGQLQIGSKVNIERSAKIGDEIGGHLVSGHVHGTASIKDIRTSSNNTTLTISCPEEWMAFILDKGFIAIDGSSLTVVNTDPNGQFTVCLIPETLKVTKFAERHIGDTVNIELDQQTVTIVKTVERVLQNRT